MSLPARRCCVPRAPPACPPHGGALLLPGVRPHTRLPGVTWCGRAGGGGVSRDVPPCKCPQPDRGALMPCLSVTHTCYPPPSSPTTSTAPKPSPKPAVSGTPVVKGGDSSKKSPGDACDCLNDLRDITCSRGWCHKVRRCPERVCLDLRTPPPLRPRTQKPHFVERGFVTVSRACLPLGGNHL